MHIIGVDCKMPGIKVKLRLDYKGKGKTGKIFGGKNIEQIAEDIRQNRVSFIRNVPVQGIYIEDIDMSQDVYSVCDDVDGKIVAYAPVFITFYADTIEDAVKFSMKEEFRTVEILEPDDITLSKLDMAHLLFKVNEELIEYKYYLERKIDNWK